MKNLKKNIDNHKKYLYISFAFIFTFILVRFLIFAERKFFDSKTPNTSESECYVLNSRIMSLKSTREPGNAGCIIQQDGKILMVKGSFQLGQTKRFNKLSVPGGTAKPDEPSACTAVRETKEETGIDVNIVGLAGIGKNSFIFYVCEPRRKITKEDLDLPRSPEIKDVLWVDLNKFDKSNIKLKKNLRFSDDINFLTEYKEKIAQEKK